MSIRINLSSFAQGTALQEVDHITIQRRAAGAPHRSRFRGHSAPPSLVSAVLL